MTEPKDKRVSVVKGAAQTTVPGGKVDLPRPQTVIAVAVAMVISGLAAIVTGLALHGHHDYLVKNLRKTSPPVTASQASSAESKVAAAIRSALTTGTVTAAEITSVGDKAADVLGDKDVIPSKNISGDDRSDQQKKVRSAVSAQLRSGATVTSATVSTTASSVGSTVRKNLTTLSDQQSADLNTRADKLPRSVVIQGIVLTLALAFVAFGAYAGRYYSRWAVPVLWVLCTFTSLPAGIYSLLQLGADTPGGYKAASAISALALLAAIVLNFMRPTRAWYDAHRPAVPAGAPQRRGLFAPRVPPPTGGTGGRPLRGRDEIPTDKPAGRPAGAKAGPPDRTRTKKRPDVTAPTTAPTTASSRPAGRPRQASKSRRTEG